MTVTPGRMLLQYRLLEKIGEGGMGEVWKAMDTELDREVAIKILPPAFSADTDRLTRFEREAKVLASLNHPCIAQIFEIHEIEGIRFLAMELAKGEDLGRRLAAGPLPLEEALKVSLQVCEALEAAHESGVIHRDLKPANIVLTGEDRVKVLDFGLAKVFEPGPASPSGDPSFSPTVTSAGTRAGVILGTAAYMSPEQARGKTIDRRTDIWSFGCLLFEVLSDRRIFDGETVSDTIALILQSEPDWSVLPESTPPRLRELLQRALEKDPKNRLRDIGDARIEIERMIAAKVWTGPAASIPTEAGVAAAQASSRRGPLPLAAAFLVGLLAGAAIWATLRSPGVGSPSPTRVSIESPQGIIAAGPQLTPDGRAVLFYGKPASPDPSLPEGARIFIRPLERSEATPISGTEGASILEVSRDSRWLAYVALVKPGSAQRRVYKTPLDGSAPPLILAEWDEDWSENMLWLSSDEILVATRKPVSLIRIATDGSGPSEPLRTELPETVPEIILTDLLPDGVQVLAGSYSWEGQGFQDRTYAVNTETGAFKKVLEDGSSLRWSSTGHLVISRQDTLLAVPFDPDRLHTTGGPITLADGLRTAPAEAGGNFDLSPSGTLVHQSGGRVGSRRRIAILGEAGRAEPWSEDRLAFQEYVDVSPDGHHLATTVMKENDLLFTVWISEVDRPRLRQWMSMPGLDCNQPLWHPDSRHLLYVCAGASQESGVYIAPLDLRESPRLLWHDEREAGFASLRSIQPNGRHILIDESTPEGGIVLRVSVEESGGPFKGEPLLPHRTGSQFAAFSPDGNWISYFSDDSGRSQLFLAPFSANGSVGPETLVTSTPESSVWWSETDEPGGFEMAYWVPPGRLQKVIIGTRPGLTVSDPELFMDVSKIRPRLLSFDPHPDGRILSLQQDEEEVGTRRIDLVLNFTEELKRLSN